MAAELSFGRRLLAVLLPTKSQAFACIIIALLVLVGAHARRVLALIGVDSAVLDISGTVVHGRLEPILTSQISASVALVTFWGGIGLAAYLICWSAFNLLIQARNEITLTTQYTNRGRWRDPIEALGIKLAGAAILIGIIALLRAALALWLSVVAGFLVAPEPASGLFALAATFGLAAHLYLILAFALVTFTPWYRPEAFTDR